MLKTVFASSTGRIRKSNQDFVQVFKNQKKATLAIVCDGMGGHQGGDVASAMAVSHLGHNFSQTDFENFASVQAWLKVQLNVENETILKTADRFSDLKGMGTTVVLAVVINQQCLIAHLGDSRAYIYDHKRLTQLVEDHSLVNELVKIGQITSEEAKNHPQKNIITQALGVSSTIEPEFRQIKIDFKDIVLLCTDGLTNSLSDVQIKNILSQTDLTLAEKCKKLVSEANRLGGQDNITVCLLTRREGDAK